MNNDTPCYISFIFLENFERKWNFKSQIFDKENMKANLKIFATKWIKNDEKFTYTFWSITK